MLARSLLVVLLLNAGCRQGPRPEPRPSGPSPGLAAKVTWSLSNVPLADVLARAQDEAGISVSAASGVDLNAPVSLELRNVSLVVAIRAACDALPRRPRLSTDATSIRLTPPPPPAELFLEFHEVSDLVSEKGPLDPDKLIALLENELGDDDGSIECSGGVLIVRRSAPDQTKLQLFLHALRRSRR